MFALGCYLSIIIFHIFLFISIQLPDYSYYSVQLYSLTRLYKKYTELSLHNRSLKNIESDQLTNCTMIVYLNIQHLKTNMIT